MLSRHCDPPFGENPDLAPIFPRQLLFAHRLARHFGHAWGQYDLQAFEPACTYRPPGRRAVRLTTVAAIRACVEGRKRIDWRAMRRAGEPPPAFVGLAGPEIDDGLVHHLTETGRLAWQIAQDGGVTLQVWRQGRTCLEATVAKDGRKLQVRPESRVRVYEARHLAILEEALFAVTQDRRGVEEVMWPLWLPLIGEARSRLEGCFDNG